MQRTPTGKDGGAQQAVGRPHSTKKSSCLSGGDQHLGLEDKELMTSRSRGSWLEAHSDYRPEEREVECSGWGVGAGGGGSTKDRLSGDVK